jgi:hypothetical protein
LKWTLPASDDPLLSVELIYVHYENDQVITQKATFKPQTVTADLTKLLVNTQYNITIYTSNQLGKSYSSNVVSFYTAKENLFSGNVQGEWNGKLYTYTPTCSQNRWDMKLLVTPSGFILKSDYLNETLLNCNRYLQSDYTCFRQSTSSNVCVNFDYEQGSFRMQVGMDETCPILVQSTCVYPVNVVIAGRIGRKANTKTLARTRKRGYGTFTGYLDNSCYEYSNRSTLTVGINSMTITGPKGNATFGSRVITNIISLTSTNLVGYINNDSVCITIQSGSIVIGYSAFDKCDSLIPDCSNEKRKVEVYTIDSNYYLNTLLPVLYAAVGTGFLLLILSCLFVCRYYYHRKLAKRDLVVPDELVQKSLNYYKNKVLKDINNNNNNNNYDDNNHDNYDNDREIFDKIPEFDNNYKEKLITPPPIAVTPPPKKPASILDVFIKPKSK